MAKIEPLEKSRVRHPPRLEEVDDPLYHESLEEDPTYYTSELLTS